MDEMRLKLLEGQIGLPGIGAVRQNAAGLLPYAVVDEAGREIEVFSVFLRDLVLTDMSPLTVRSYGNDLLRWWRVLQLIGVPWDRAGRLEVEVMVGWMRSAVNPQRRGSGGRVMNPRIGKRPLAAGYAPAPINHAVAVLASFYAFHARFGRGPVMNPVPESAGRRARLAHRSALEETPGMRRAPLRQKAAVLAPRSIPDDLVDELIGALRTSRDRALVSLYLSSGARASELLGVRGDQVDWARRRVWVVSKGSRTLEPVPACPESLLHLAAYFHEHGTPGSGEPIWRALHGKPRPLNYHAARRVLQRANTALGTDWSLHDLRHLFATDLVIHGLPIHIGAALLGHIDVQTTHGYVTVFQEDVIRHYQAHLAGRRAARPAREYRAATDTEWAEFEEHFDKRKVELGNCGRPYATPCEHEHACIRCPMLQVDPVMIGRLDEINNDLITRRELAETKGWLGELEGIDLTLRFLQDKREDAQRMARLGPTNLGMPVVRP